MSKSTLIVLTAGTYLLTMAGVVASLFCARRQAVQLLDTPAQQAEWDDFTREMDHRHEQREQARDQFARSGGQAIVKKPPKPRSPRPPALELLDRHFPACLTVCSLAGTLLYAILWGMIVGACLRPGRLSDERAAAPGGEQAAGS